MVEAAESVASNDALVLVGTMCEPIDFGGRFGNDEVRMKIQSNVKSRDFHLHLPQKMKRWLALPWDSGLTLGRDLQSKMANDLLLMDVIWAELEMVKEEARVVKEEAAMQKTKVAELKKQLFIPKFSLEIVKALKNKATTDYVKRDCHT
ncbi:hypothetical protein AXF42_Ash021675 [Apostasia shenzhenica]|uniref:Uncharacterized protein n=1 Tax=Apostasia shenzhenica TaxID=1088818 RepID=A0A2H9ZYL5_9ASPA|nr:hypothetical protein AXF42_Ash021675 [Apostasia shenzhenica]